MKIIPVVLATHCCLITCSIASSLEFRIANTSNLFKMHIASLVTSVLACASVASGTLTWSLQKVSNPTADQADAYGRIENAMRAAVSRYHRFTGANKTIRVYYAPGVPTAEASYNGDLRFGSNRSYMTERTAMHEISQLAPGHSPAPFFRRTECAHQLRRWTLLAIRTQL
jgi:hypothetical protein